MLFSAIFGTLSFPVTPAWDRFRGRYFSGGDMSWPGAPATAKLLLLVTINHPDHRAGPGLSGRSTLGLGAQSPPPQIVARPPNLAVLLTHPGPLILGKVSKYDTTRCQILRQVLFPPGLRPRPRWGSLQDSCRMWVVRGTTSLHVCV